MTAAAPTFAAAHPWPRTTRLFPWLVACFLAMVWIIPFDAVRLPFNVGVDSTPDRVLLPLLVGTFVLAATASVGPRRGGRLGVIGVALFAFVAIAVASVMANYETLFIHDEVDAGIKRLATLISYAVLFAVVAKGIRRDEVRPFAVLCVGLACITALGTIWEYRSGFNVFYRWADAASFGGITVTPPAELVNGVPWGRPQIAGPTSHGLAIATMMGMAIPFTIVALMRTTGYRRLLVAAACGILLAGSVSTLRKSGAVVPAAALLALLVMRPRQMIRLLPIGLATVLFIQLLAPGALVKVKAQLTPDRINNNSTQGRTVDYDAVGPDVLNNFTFGRGFGTYDPKTYRYLDNEYLKRIIETGMVGALVYLALVLAVIGRAVRLSRDRDGVEGAIATAIAAGAVAYGVAGLLYDVLFFPQAPYLFLFLAALLVAASSDAPTTARTRVAVPRAAPATVGAPAPPPLAGVR